LVGYTFDDVIEIYTTIEDERIKGYICNKCGDNVYKSHNDGYFAQCYNCDEDFYECELNKINNKSC